MPKILQQSQGLRVGGSFGFFCSRKYVGNLTLKYFIYQHRLRLQIYEVYSNSAERYWGEQNRSTVLFIVVVLKVTVMWFPTGKQSFVYFNAEYHVLESEAISYLP